MSNNPVTNMGNLFANSSSGNFGNYNPGQQYQTNNNAFQWGQQPGGAAAAQAQATQSQGQENVQGQQFAGQMQTLGNAYMGNSAINYNAANQYAQATQPNYASANQYAQQVGQAGQQGQFQFGQASRQDQTAMGLQRAAAMGQTPSAADIQMQAGTDAAVRSQQAAAASARGPAGLAMAQQNAAGNTASLQQQAVTQGAALRAQEQATAQSAYAQSAAQAQQSSLASQAQNQGVALQEQQAQAAQAGTSAQDALAQQQQQAAQAQNTTASLEQGIQGQASMYAQGAQGQQGYETLGQGYAGQGINVGTQELNAQGNQQAINASNQQAAQSNALQQWLGQNQYQQFNTSQKTGLLSSIIGGAGGALALSDERQKEDIEPESSFAWGNPYAAPRDMLDKLQPYSFKYKQGIGEDQERHYGVMAQDLEKSAMGQSLVRETPRGKEVDIRHATLASLAAGADLHDRVTALEKRFSWGAE